MIDKILFKSKKVFDEFNKTYDSITSIKMTRKKIDEYYSQEISSESLLKTLNNFEFQKNQDYSIAVSIITGVITGLLVQALTEMGSVKSTKNSIADFILVLILFLIFILLVSLVVVFLYQRLRKLYTNNYSLYIVPYECSVVKKKLYKDYEIELQNDE